MKFFIDTANVDEIRKANDMGIICRCYHQPQSLIAKEGRDYRRDPGKEIADHRGRPHFRRSEGHHRGRRGHDRRGP